jgi:hypothetical protein
MLCFCAFVLPACSLVPTHIQETHYIAVPSGGKFNYFRIRVNADATLSDVKYHSGWYPAEAVESLYGSANEGDAAEAYKLKNDIKKLINDAILKTETGYLDAASNPNSDPAVVQAWLTAQRRVRAMPGVTVPLPDGAIEIEYNPASAIALRHAGEKLVFVFSANPDEVVGAIEGFAKQAEVGATVLQLADVVRQQSVNEVATKEAENAASAKMNATLVAQLDALTKVLEGNPTAAQLRTEVKTLQMVLENSR